MSSLSKQSLLILCKTLGINVPSIKYKSKEQLRQLIKDYEDTKNTKVLQTGKQIKHIYHSADIHIRTLERHAEYKGVFDNLINYLKEQPEIEESVFVICGDIFHNRDRLISETIILFNTWIEKLTEVLPVIMIPGNHDIFSHTDRMDTISGIVNIKGYNNFYFLKYSGIYCFNNINFVVSSLVDNKFLGIKDVPNVTPEIINIALYHGSLSGSKLDNDFTVPDSSGHSFSVKDFAGFDYTLLGDIHKRQFLTPSVAYPGSLIQQNFKEEQSHGIIHWNLETKEGKFVDIANDYSYITLNIKNNEIDVKEKYTKYSRVKLIHSYNEEIDYEKIRKDLSQHTNVLSVSKEILNETLQETPVESPDTKEVIPLQTKLFNKLLEPYTPEQKQQLTKLHIDYLEKYCEADKLQNVSVSWYIKSLEFQNVYMYGGDHINTLNFEDKKGVIGILQSNAAGKSSIMNIIMYTLFGHITKNKSFLNRNIINKKSNKYYIKMVIRMGDKDYTIHREGKNKTRKDKSLSMEEKIEFTVVSGEELINLTDTDKVTTQEKIKSTFGLTDKDLYTLTNVINYSMYISLLSMTSSDISLVFSKLFNLEHFKLMHSAVLKETKTFTDKIKFLESKKEDLENSIQETIPKGNLEEINEKQNLKNKEIEVIELKYNKLIKEIACINSSVIEKPIFLEKEEELRKQLNNLSSHVTNDLTLNEINRRIKQLNLIIGSNKIATTENINTLTEKKNKITLHKVIRPCSVAEYTAAQGYIKNFNFGEELIFDTTKDGNVVIKKDQVQRFKAMYNLFKDTNLLKKYTDTTILVKEYARFTELIKANNELKKEQEKLEAQINYLNEQELLQLNECKLKLELTEKLNNIETYKKSVKDNVVKKELQKEQKVLELEKKQIQGTLKILTEEETKIKLYIEQQTNTKKKIEEIKKQLKILQEQENLYKLYKAIINDKSLPKMILSNTIKQVEREANKLIYSLAGLLVNVTSENDNENTKWEIVIKKNNTLLGSEQVSGYERFIINAGLKMALDKYKFYSGSSVFFIDEAFDCVSEENLDKIDQLFDYLKTYYRHIIIVSHNEELKKKIDYRINIETDFICSKVNF